MNINQSLRSLATKISSFIPRSIHRQILKQYELDRTIAVAAGYVCVRQDWSSPVVVREDIDVLSLGNKRDLPGVILDDRRFTQLGGELAAFAHEFPWRNGKTGTPEVPWGDMFPTLDSMVLYAMIRRFQPKNYIEVGCGYSSRVSSTAAVRNQQEGAHTSIRYIEPYPSPRLETEKLQGVLIQKRIQDVPLDTFSELESGDILFIDTSHILKCQSDVEWELLHILPALKKGVIIHIHDLFTPFEQPLTWLENNYAPGYYNEQYAVEAMLGGGDKFKTLFPLHHLCRERPEDMLKWFSHHADFSRSYWIIVD